MSNKIQRGVKFGEFGLKKQEQINEESKLETELEGEDSDFEYEYGWVQDALTNVDYHLLDLDESSEAPQGQGIEDLIAATSDIEFENEITVEEITVECVKEIEFPIDEKQESYVDSKRTSNTDSKSGNVSTDLHRRLKLIQKLRNYLSNSQ